MILTRSGSDELFPRLLKDRDTLWVNGGVLSGAEVADLRSGGWDLPTWTNPLTDLWAEIDMVQLHHPNQVVWAETAVVTDAG